MSLSSPNATGRLIRPLLIATIVLAVASVVLAVLTGRLSETFPSKPDEVVFEGSLAQATPTSLTITLDRRRGYRQYLSLSQSLDLTLAVTPSTTFAVIFTPELTRLSGDDVRRTTIPITSLQPNDRLRVTARVAQPASRQLIAQTVLVIRVRKTENQLPTNVPALGAPTPGDLR